MPEKEPVEVVQVTAKTTEDTQGTKQEVEQETQPTSRIYTEKEYLAEVDRRVTAALAKEKAKAEEVLLKQQGKVEELLEKRDKEIAQLRFHSEAQTLFNQKQAPELGQVLLKDLTTIEGLSSAIDSINELIQTKLNAEVKARMNTGKVISNATPLPNIPIKDMTPEQYLLFKKEKNIQS